MGEIVIFEKFSGIFWGGGIGNWDPKTSRYQQTASLQALWPITNAGAVMQQLQMSIASQ